MLPDGCGKDFSCLRVDASKISTFPLDLIAKNLLHGDHTILSIQPEHLVVAIAGSHNIGTPFITLSKGWVYCSYNFRTIDVWGDRGRAE